MSGPRLWLCGAASPALSLLLGCGAGVSLPTGAGGAGGQGASGGGLVQAACGVGPLDVYWGDCPEPLDMPGCPKKPAGTYTSLIGLTYCGFAGGLGDCTPRHLCCPGCPAHNSFSLKRTVTHPKGHEVGEATFGVAVIPAAGGAFELTWTTQELDPATNTPIGPQLGGKQTLPSICCQVVWDVYFPNGNYTSRFKVMTDWDTLK